MTNPTTTEPVLEEWRPIKGWPYEVSNRGRVRRARAYNSTYAGRVLKHYEYPETGERVVALHDAGKRRNTFVHHLVARAFVGEPPGNVGNGSNDYQINHKDGDRTNNRPENLEWVTSSQNAQHAFDTGLRQPFCPRGEINASTKLTREEVHEIRWSMDGGYADGPTLADRYGVSPSAIYAISRRNNWGWLEEVAPPESWIREQAAEEGADERR